MNATDTANKSDQTWLLNAQAAWTSGNQAAAAEIIRQAYATDEQLQDGYAQLGGFFMECKEWDSALKWMQKDVYAMRISPMWKLNYAVVLTKCGSIQKAQKAVHDAYQGNPHLTDGYARIGYALYWANDHRGALELMQIDVKAKRVTPLWTVRYIRVLAACGHLDEALAHLDSFCDRFANTKLKWTVWLSVSQLYIGLRCVEKVEPIRERVVAENPQNAGEVLNAFAGIIQSSVLQSWMAGKGRTALVCENNESNRPAPKQPQNKWPVAVRAYEQALANGADLAATGDLWKVVRANLFVAGGQLASHDVQSAEHSVASCVHLITNNLNSADEIRLSKTLLQGPRDATGYASISQFIDDLPTLKSGAWNALSDLLQWFGFLRLGYAAWKRSASATYTESEAVDSNPRIVTQAFRAATTLGDYDRALDYINKLPAPIAHDAKRYLSLHGIDTGVPHASWRPESTLQKDPFFHYLKNKNVSIVGPAPTGESSGKQIDQADCVVRTAYNGVVPGEFSEFGSKTNISTYAALVSLQWEHEQERPAYLEELEFYTFSPIVPRAGFLQEDIAQGKARPLWTNPNFYHKYPNAIQRIIYDLLQYPVHKIRLHKTNFFLSLTSYTDRYLRPDYTHSSGEKGPLQMPFRQTLIYGHDLICQIAFVRNLWKAGVIEADQACQNVLELSNEQYMEHIEQLHGA